MKTSSEIVQAIVRTIIIVAVPRSGSTLLFDLLSGRNLCFALGTQQFKELYTKKKERYLTMERALMQPAFSLLGGLCQSFVITNEESM